MVCLHRVLSLDCSDNAMSSLVLFCDCSDFEKRTNSELQEKFNQTERERLQLVTECQRLTEATRNATEINGQLAALQKELQNTQQRYWTLSD